AREEREKIAPCFHVELAEKLSCLHGAHQIIHAAADIGRALEDERPQHISDALHGGPVAWQRFGIFLRESRDFLLREPLAYLQVAILERKEVGKRALDDAKAVRGKT